MIIFIDIDNTICDSSYALDYSRAKPIKENIDIANALFDSGHTIIYWTARGSGTGKDWAETTYHQLNTWGVKYHELRFHKPVYDLFIDDKAITRLSDVNLDTK